MEKEKTIGIKVFGWFLIILSFLYLFAFPKIISSYYKLCSAMVGLPDNINFIPKLTAYSIFTISIGFFLFLITGIGILKLKRWAYYIALFIPFMYFMGILKNIWLFGPQSIMRPSLVSILLISIIILLYLMKKNIIEQFDADYITKRGKNFNPKKFIIWSSVVVVLVNAIPIGLWLLFVNTRYKDQLPIINLKPHKVGYQIQDESFILNNCEKRDVFDFSLSIPKDWKVYNISMGDSGFGWNLSFLNMENSNLKAFIMIDNKGFGRLLLPISKVLNFNTVYDFEKTINYPNWTPIYLILKTIGSPKNLEGIDEAAAYTWKGFVKVIKSKEKNIYDASLYSLKRNKTCSVCVLFKDGAMNSAQAKSIIASLEFGAIERQSGPLFEKGKIDLSNADFTSAAINFMNALYIDEKNPEYAYYLARSLFEESSTSGRKSRLGSSKKFLEYALKLKPNYQDAGELLISVDNEIKKTEQNKKE
jgi:hypothetical protein